VTLPINLFIFFWLLATGSRVRGTWCPGKWWRAPLLPTWGNRNGTESQTGRTLTFSYIQKKHLQKSEVTENLIVLKLIRLLENLECTMIYDAIKRISREHTLVVSERGRDDATLPTDLWKKTVSTDSVSRKTPRIFSRYRNKRLTHTTSGNKTPRRILNFEKLVCGFVESIETSQNQL